MTAKIAESTLNNTLRDAGIDLSKYVGIDPTVVDLFPLSKVMGDWEYVYLSHAEEYRQIGAALVPVVVLLIRFTCNTLMAGKMLHKRRDSVFWLNLLQCVLGVAAAVCAIIRGLAPWAISCKGVSSSAEANVYVGTSAIVGILFVKAYYGTKHSRIVLCIGALAILLTFAVGLMSIWAMVTFEYGSGRCAMALDYRWIISKFVVDIASNVSLTGCFLYAIWLQTRNKKHHVSWLLFQDGLIYGFGVAVSNVATNAIVLNMHSLTFWHAHIYAVDYCIVSTLVCRQLWQARVRYARHRRTNRIKITEAGAAILLRRRR
ncbi:hypothetical protein THASP1DRAFT_27666 [Thamnocephalis sphaerospora]|uniref:Uncharacterized protein n=1 Tax=Thamnocephalis sphaerospora TaxID=78915 RepID=A0A4P9XX07_9FUNG|nr:hypothetical protein THASP1DRAFT_27666 [Thamnocephalis sphaerospora]|eukprot:RKP10532.1 hypothetical protein THASP1DRAFT_27666 [Thamnocephalis sphaerospora]